MQGQEWQNKKEVIKGNIGENIVRLHLEQKGYIVYEPVTNAAHHFDKLISKNKKYLAIVEIKTYEKLKYKEETGINLKNYNEYLDIKNIPVFVFFVDHITKSIYGNKLNILQQEKIINNKKFPYVMETKTGSKQMFHLSSMKTIYNLTEEQCLILKQKTNISEQYKT